MSDLAKSFARTKLGALPPEPPLQEEDSYDDSSSASSMSSIGTIRPTSSHKAAEPSSWNEFFEQELFLESETESFHAKYHVYYTPPKDLKRPLLVLHHGAGSSGLSFAIFAREFRKLMPDTGILCLEAREHGSTVWDNASSEVTADLSIDLLSRDMAEMILLTQKKLDWPALPELMLVGHSLGGAVVTNLAYLGLLDGHVLGYAVLDVVEGSAMDALKHMQSYLATRPSVFTDMSSAIDWHLRTRTLRNAESARASVPTLFVRTQTGKYVWRTDLSRTETYWSDWFGAMSSKFLNGKAAKLLILAGTDRLDKELMIGQMQGKFQLNVLPAAGHFLQEDLPEETAGIIAEFIKRNDKSVLVLPPKVSDLLAQGKKV